MASPVPVEGILNLAKPQGMTSREVVDQVCRITRQSRVGHAGTLDPLATGVLVVCCGRATRLVELIQTGTKEYLGSFRLGQSSDTDDSTGQLITHDCPQWPTRDEIAAVLPEFHGHVWQVPPAFSALKLSGQRAYELARQGAAVELPARQIWIDELRIEQYFPPDLKLFIRCGSGTYVRAIGRDIGRKLGCGALMTELVRTRVGPFHLQQATSIEELSKETLSAHLQPLETAVQELPQLHCSEDEERRVRMGQRIPVSDTLRTEIEANRHHSVAALDAAGRLIGVGWLRDGILFQPQTIFPH